MSKPTSSSSAVRWLIEKAAQQTVNVHGYVDGEPNSLGKVRKVRVERDVPVAGTGYFCGDLPHRMAEQVREHAEKVSGERFAKAWTENGFRFHAYFGDKMSTQDRITFTFEPIDPSTWDAAYAAAEALLLAETGAVAVSEQV